MKIIATSHLGIELTQECNLNCAHCFRGPARKISISKEILEKVFDEVKYVHVLDLSGGEVFLGYEQLKLLLEIAKAKNVIIKSCSMLINGTIYDERIYKLLDEYFGNNYYVGISSDDFHDESIRKIYGKKTGQSEDPGLSPQSMIDIKNNMAKHYYNSHSIGFQRVSNRLINNGRASTTNQTPHKEFEALGYYYNDSSSSELLVGPMIFVGADGFISDINSDIGRRAEQSLGNIASANISDLVLNGGIEIKCKDSNEFFALMDKREEDFATHQGDHLIFKNGKMVHTEYKPDEEYTKAIEGLDPFLKRASEAMYKGPEAMAAFLKTDPYFEIHKDRDLSQTVHRVPDENDEPGEKE